MKKNFNDLTAQELETELRQEFSDNIDEIASNYNMSREHFITELIEKRKKLLGVYKLRSPYHSEEVYLPFVVMSYAKYDKDYSIMTVEYKGLISYKVNGYYPAKSVDTLILNGTITKVANMNEITGNEEVEKLIAKYRNAK